MRNNPPKSTTLMHFVMETLFCKIVNKLCQEEPIADNRFPYQINSIGKYLDNMFMKVFESKLLYLVTQGTYICYIKERISRYILSEIKVLETTK